MRVVLFDMPENKPPQSGTIADDCFAHDQQRMRHGEAVSLLRKRVTAMAGNEKIPLDFALGRIVAEKVSAPRNIPLYDNSAVDGFAYAAQDYEKAAGLFEITGRIAAGDKQIKAVRSRCAVRIFTGATVPGGIDTIAMQEDCETRKKDGAEFVFIPPGLKQGANLRKAGEDLCEGDAIVELGQRLRPQDLAAIASAGKQYLSVFGKLRVALISSGNEVRRPGEKLETGQVYDSNYFLLGSLLESLPVTISDLGVLPDNAADFKSALAQAASKFDVLISTGGASRGEEDHMITTLKAIGKSHLWQLAIKPGRPMCFGQIDSTPVFALPGNPVAAFICFLLYVRPCLLVLGGSRWIEPSRFPIPAGFSIPKKKPDRREFWRGWVKPAADGTLTAQKFSRDGSGLISGLRRATGLIEIPEEITRIEPGDMVDYIPFGEFGIS